MFIYKNDYYIVNSIFFEVSPMPKISNLPIVSEIGPEDLLLITDIQNNRARTKQASIGLFTVLIKETIGEASASGSGLLSSEFYNYLFNATSLPTPGTLVKRDEDGRFQAQDPDDQQDVTTKSYVDSAIESAVKIYKQSVTGSVTSFNINHNIGTRDVIVQVYDLSTYDTVFVDVFRSSINQVQVNFSSPPGSSSYQVLVQGTS
jgi:hypothetical protein